MREILFRGKSIDEFESLGEWVYGGIVHQTDWYGDKSDYWFIIDGTRTDYDLGYAIGVDKNTICQYTGLCDKNGKKIFEGDIIKAGKNFNVLVKWDNSTASYVLVDTTWIVNGEEHRYTALWDTLAKKLEVIGNIHDSPDLLGGK